jgi:hypothetical protein
LDAANLSNAWSVCESLGLELSSGNEPLDRPRDRWLAERVIAGRALTCATQEHELQIDFTLVMAGFAFENRVGGAPDLSHRWH